MPQAPQPGTLIDLESTSTLLAFLPITRQVVDGPSEFRAVQALGPSRGLSSFGDELASVFYVNPNWRDHWYTFIFDEPMRIRAHYVLGGFTPQNPGDGTYGRARMDFSKDSTNGVDGDWNTVQPYVPGRSWTADQGGNVFLDEADTTLGSAANPLSVIPGTVANNSLGAGGRPYSFLGSMVQAPSPDQPGWIEVSGSAYRQIRAVRVWTNGANPAGSAQAYTYGVKALLWGEPDTEATLDRVTFWQAGADLRHSAATLNWGDLEAASFQDKVFRIKNESGASTAENIQLSARASGYSTSPSPHAFLSFSLDGVNFTNSVSIAALAPGTVSPTIYVRNVVPAAAALGLWQPQILAEVGEWA